MPSDCSYLQRILSESGRLQYMPSVCTVYGASDKNVAGYKASGGSASDLVCGYGVSGLKASAYSASNSGGGYSALTLRPSDYSPSDMVGSYGVSDQMQLTTVHLI